MKICVTGAGGFIGRSVVEALNDTNQTILSPPRSELDLSNPEQIESYLSTHRPTHLIHLAWYAEHGKFWNAPDNFDWVINTIHLLRSFHKNGGERIVCAGTCAEYDWSVNEIFHEYDSPIAPHSVYGQCKDATRRLVQSYCEANDLSWAWGRVFLPYGPGEAATKLIPSLIRTFQKSEFFGINQNVERDFLYIEDVAGAFVKLIENNEDGIFNISSGAHVLLKDLAEDIARILERDPAPILQLDPETRDPVQKIVGDNTRLKSLGWVQKTSLQDGLQNYVSLL